MSEYVNVSSLRIRDENQVMLGKCRRRFSVNFKVA